MDCPYCGGANLSAAKFCMHCSAPLTGTPGQAQPQTQMPPQAPPITPSMNAPSRPVMNQPIPGMAAPAMAAPGVAVPNHLVWAILVTLFCCLPGGIVAIIFASQVGTKLAVGDVQGAVEASNKAKTWCWVGFGVGLGVMLLWILLAVVAEMANM